MKLTSFPYFRPKPHHCHKAIILYFFDQSVFSCKFKEDGVVVDILLVNNQKNSMKAGHCCSVH